jgi:ABC-type multidrug transport system fused ATPase/permease subunit
MTITTLLKEFCGRNKGPIAGYVLLLLIATVISLVAITRTTAKLYKSVSGDDRSTSLTLLIALLILTMVLTMTNWAIDYIENRLMPRFHEFVRGRVTNDIIDANETNMMTNTNALRFRAYVSATTASTTMVFNSIVKQYVPKIMMAVVLIGFLLYLSWEFGMVFLVGAGMLAGVFALNRRNMLANSRHVETKIRYADTFAFDVLKNLQTVVAKGQIAAEKSAIDAQLMAAASAQIESNQKFDNISYILNGMLAAMVMVTMALAIRKLGAGGKDSEAVVFSVLTALSLMVKLQAKMTALNNTNLAMVQSVGRYDANVLAEVVNYKAPPPGRFRVCGGAEWCSTTLEFRDVRFAYAGTSRAVIDGFSWKIGPRGVFCLRAPSGSGKTTLTNLVLRMFEPTQGSILLNGKDVRTLDINDLRRSVVLLNQDQGFLQRTIREILCFGLGDACPTEEATLAVWDDMKEMFDGLTLDSNVGSNGNKLSTGMKTMLRFNAVLLSRASVVICDEPTNGLSPVYKSKVLQVIRDLALNKMVLLITHDHDTAAIAQEIRELVPPADEGVRR